MAKHSLHARSRAVVHRSKNRTRLRVPKKYRQHESMRKVQTRIERIPGVQSVVINSQTGSVLVHHDETPDLLDEIGAAFEESAPDILMAMVGGEEAELGLGFLTSFAKSLFTHEGTRAAAGNGGGSAAAETFGAGGITAKQALPLMLIAAGVWKMMQDEALLGSLAPLALFYYGFDLAWKFREENRTVEIERIATHHPSESHSSEARKSTKDHA